MTIYPDTLNIELLVIVQKPVDNTVVVMPEPDQQVKTVIPDNFIQPDEVIGRFLKSLDQPDEQFSRGMCFRI